MLFTIKGRLRAAAMVLVDFAKKETNCTQDGCLPLHDKILDLTVVVFNQLQDTGHHLGLGGGVDTESLFLELRHQVIGGHVTKVLVSRGHLPP